MKKTLIKLLALSLVAIMACVALVSCGGPNADPDKAEKALEEAGYAVTKLENVPGVDGLSCFISAMKLDGEDVEGIVIYYFEDLTSAADAWENIQKVADQAKEEQEDIVVKKSGKIIYYGTEDAIKAAK